MAVITKTSILTGISRTLEIPEIEQLELDRVVHAYEQGLVELREALPDLAPHVLEFIRSGTTIKERKDYHY